MLISNIEKSELLLLPFFLFFFLPTRVTKIEEILTLKARTSSIHPALHGIANSPTEDDLKEQHHRQDFTHPRIQRIYQASSIKYLILSKDEGRAV